MRVLVLSGGGSRGAWQAGAVRALAESGHTWDVVAGVSVGAMNGAFVAHFAPSEQRKAGAALEVLWHRITGNESIYKRWWLGKIAALWKGGLYNTAPMEKMVRTHLDPARVRASGVKLRLGAVALSSGEYKYVTEDEEDLASWVMASSAFPVAFPPRWINGEAWTDGGVRDVTPIRDILADIHGQTATIDVVLTGPLNGERATMPVAKARNALNVALRAGTLLAEEAFLNDLRAVQLPAGVTMQVYAPKTALPYDALDFSPEKLRAALKLGYEDVLSGCR